MTFQHLFDVVFFFCRETTLKKVKLWWHLCIVKHIFWYFGRGKKFLFSTHRFRISLYNNTLVQSTYISKSFSGKKILLTTNLRNVEANNVEHFCYQRTFDVPAGRILKTVAIYQDLTMMMMQLYIAICYVRTFKFLGWDDWWIMTTYESIVFGAAASEGRVFTSEKKTWFFLFSIRSWKDGILYIAFNRGVHLHLTTNRSGTGGVDFYCLVVVCWWLASSSSYVTES